MIHISWLVRAMLTFNLLVITLKGPLNRVHLCVIERGALSYIVDVVSHLA